MIDVLVSMAIGFVLSLLLLKRNMRPTVVLLLVVLVGASIGWQAKTLFSGQNTSLTHALNVTPEEMRIIFEATQSSSDPYSISRVAGIAKNYGVSMLIAFNALAAIAGFLFARIFTTFNKLS